MPIEPYFDQKEPSENVEIWRFLSLKKFEDLMGTQELYFRRADLFPQDDEEGIPPEDYLRLIMGSQRFVLEDETELNHQIGSLSQMRETYYVSHFRSIQRPELVTLRRRNPCWRRRQDVSVRQGNQARYRYTEHDD